MNRIGVCFPDSESTKSGGEISIDKPYTMIEGGSFLEMYTHVLHTIKVM